MKTRATSDTLDQLHLLTADALERELKRALKRATDNPDKPEFAVSPQLLDKLMKFLAMNGVTAAATSPRFDEMKGVLEKIDIDAEMARPKH